MDKKALKEEKKKQKLEKFLNKQIKATTITKSNKVIKKPSANGYDPTPVEQKWNEYWLKEDLFSPKTKEKIFIIPMPPPNITGSLHIGHAMMVAIQDSLCRYKRMTGHEVLYLPGTDHAGIATQTVVMKQLTKDNKEESINKLIDREYFINATWEWKEKYGSRILEQFKRLGSSADTTRQRFTMDPDMNKAVTEAFCTLFEKGLIYRDNKIVNWCAKLQTTLSDIEIDHLSVEPNTFLKVDNRDYEFGVIYVFKYPAKNTELGFIEVGTTRPETILGDVALCANPKDTRYNKDIIPINPITNKELKFVFDDAADIDLESGVLKVTPAHDPVDFEIGKRHNLEQVKIFDNNNKIIEGEYKGLGRLEVRDLVIQKLIELDLFIAKKPKEQILPICSRSGDLIEPVIKEQWWCECTGMAKKAIEVVKNNEMIIHPLESKDDWFRWFENPRDWCLSRQLWWGHRIPAYKSPDGIWSIGRSKEEAVSDYNKQYNTSYNIESFVQDEDVLDTWFSSGLWPFATLGWPNENSKDLERYFPASLLETGKDILFFWVGRMVMMSLELTGKVPFNKVLLHGIVRDANGRKMSKSLGNVIDPIHVIDGASLDHLLEVMKLGNLSKENQKNAELVIRKDFPNGIEKCGADALRFTLLSYMNGINDIKLDIERVKGNRKFCNKIWNAFLFVKQYINNEYTDSDIIYDDLLTWIIEKRNKVISITHSSFENYNFMQAVQAIHQFFLYDFCDIYIEVVKKVKKQSYIPVLVSLLLDSIKIFSPYMPFITEEIYSHFNRGSLLNASFPEIIPVSGNSNFENLLKKVKSLRADLEKYGKNKVDVVLDGVKEEDLEYVSALVSNIRNISVGEYNIKEI